MNGLSRRTYDIFYNRECQCGGGGTIGQILWLGAYMDYLHHNLEIYKTYWNWKMCQFKNI